MKPQALHFFFLRDNVWWVMKTIPEKPHSWTTKGGLTVEVGGDLGYTKALEKAKNEATQVDNQADVMKYISNQWDDFSDEHIVTIYDCRIELRYYPRQKRAFIILPKLPILEEKHGKTPDIPPVTVSLKPFHTLAIMTFLHEQREVMDDPRLQSLKEAITAYEKELFEKVTSEQLEDARLDREIAESLGTEPNPDDI